jgi:hypothetical protein
LARDGDVVQITKRVVDVFSPQWCFPVAARTFNVVKAARKLGSAADQVDIFFRVPPQRKQQIEAAAFAG